MQLIELAKKNSHITLDRIKEIAKEYNINIKSMPKNSAHFLVKEELEKMLWVADAYLYDGRDPVENPEILDFDKHLFTIARCIARLDLEELYCHNYTKNVTCSLITKSHFYFLTQKVYSKYYRLMKSGQRIKRNNTLMPEKDFKSCSELINNYLIKDMRDEEYEEWKYFFNISCI